jgi:Protein of unknown function (DUF2971)
MVNYLYKYESLTQLSLENLKAQRIYFGSPKHFNDPYDCSLCPIVLMPTDAEVVQVRKKYLTELNFNAEMKNNFEARPIENLRNLFHIEGEKAISIAIDDFMDRRGVSCFSETNDNLLMWSHYGGKYKGFCLEFSTAFDPFKNAKKVIYQDTIPSINIVPYLIGIDSDSDQTIQLFCTKSESWRYEREWRVIHSVSGTLYGYPSHALTGIYFGPEISEESFEIVCLILLSQNSNVKFYKGFRSATEFRVIFQEITYTPHLEAIRKGLIKPNLS